MESQNRALRRAYLWNAIGMFARNVLGFGISVMLARLLSPRDFGLMTLAAVFVEVASSLQDLGLRNVVIYYKENENELPTYTTISTGFGLALTLLGWLAAPFVAAFYNEPRLVALFRVTCLSFLIGGIRAVSSGILTKRMEFKTLTLAESASTLSGALIALALALLGCGVWSLVANLVATAAIGAAIILWIVPPRFTLRPQWAAWKKVRRYGLQSMFSSVLWRVYDQSDFMVIGRTLGSNPLGVYSLAFRLATLVNEKIGAIVSGVSFPALSSLRSDRERVIGHWFALMRLLSMVCFPVLAMLAVAADDFVQVVYGVKWSGAIMPLRILCVVGVLRTLTPVSLGLTSAQGRADVNLKYALINTVLLPIAFVGGSLAWGLTGVALAWALIFPLSCAYLFRAATTQVGVSFRAFARNLRFPVFAALASVPPMLLVRALLSPGIERLFVEVGAGCCACGAVMLMNRETRGWLLDGAAKIGLRPKRTGA